MQKLKSKYNILQNILGCISVIWNIEMNLLFVLRELYVFSTFITFGSVILNFQTAFK